MAHDKEQTTTLAPLSSAPQDRSSTRANAWPTHKKKQRLSTKQRAAKSLRRIVQGATVVKQLSIATEPEPEVEPEPEPEDQATLALRERLRKLRPVSLYKRCIAEGIDESVLQAAMDTEDSKTALIELLVTASAIPAGAAGGAQKRSWSSQQRHTGDDEDFEALSITIEDHDGGFSKQETKEYLLSLGLELQDIELDMMWNIVDEDGNGTISKPEFLRLRFVIEKLKEGVKMGRALRLLDEFNPGDPTR